MKFVIVNNNYNNNRNNFSNDFYTCKIRALCHYAIQSVLHIVIETRPLREHTWIGIFVIELWIWLVSVVGKTQYIIMSLFVLSFFQKIITPCWDSPWFFAILWVFRILFEKNKRLPSNSDHIFPCFLIAIKCIVWYCLHWITGLFNLFVFVFSLRLPSPKRVFFLLFCVKLSYLKMIVEYDQVFSKFC